MSRHAERGPVRRTIHHVTDTAHDAAGYWLVIVFEHYRSTRTRLTR